MPRYAKDTLNELLKDPDFAKEWESMEPEFQIIKAMIDARNEKGITQKELSSITGKISASLKTAENQWPSK